MGWLMVWGTVLLFVDAIAIILLYERLGTWLRRWPAARSLISLAVVLSVDQTGFFMALRYVSDAPLDALFGGWCAKMGAAVVYSLLISAYLKWLEPPPPPAPLPPPPGDVFKALTYRERYEHLLAHSGRDSLRSEEHTPEPQAQMRNPHAARG